MKLPLSHERSTRARGIALDAIVGVLLEDALAPMAAGEREAFVKRCSERAQTIVTEIVKDVAPKERQPMAAIVNDGAQKAIASRLEAVTAKLAAK
jgi:hypothetical protein